LKAEISTILTSQVFYCYGKKLNFSSDFYYLCVSLSGMNNAFPNWVFFFGQTGQ